MMKQNFSYLKATYINCILKNSLRIGNTNSLAEVSISIMKKEKADVDYFQWVYHGVPHGEAPDMDMTKQGEEKD